MKWKTLPLHPLDPSPLALLVLRFSLVALRSSLLAVSGLDIRGQPHQCTGTPIHS